MANDNPDWSLRSQSSQLDTVITLVESDHFTKDYTLDPDCHAVALVLSFPQTNFSSVTVTGKTTGQEYGGNLLSLGGFSSLFLVPVLSVWDPVVTVDITTTAFGAGNAFCWPAQVLDNVAVGLFQLQQYKVVQQNPAPWQGPREQVQAFASSATTSTMKAALAGVATRVWGCSIEIDGQTSGTTLALIQDGSGLELLAVALTGAGSITDSAFHDGVPMTPNTDLLLNVTQLGAGSISVRANASITQAAS